MGGIESPFGREFDSLAGLDFVRSGSGLFGLSSGSALRLCGLPKVGPGGNCLGLSALRRVSARAPFNCLSAQEKVGRRQGVPGLPDTIGPAGLVASLTFADNQLNENEKELGKIWKYPAGGRAGIPFGDDGEHGQVSQFQVARHSIRQHFHQRSDNCRDFSRLGCGALGQNSFLRSFPPFSHFTSFMVSSGRAFRARCATRSKRKMRRRRTGTGG